HSFHGFDDVVVLDPVLVQRHVAVLPWTVHLIADAPQADIEGLGTAALRTRLSQARIGGAVAILHFFRRGAGISESTVDGKIRLGSEKPAEGNKLMDAHVIRFDPVRP